MRPGLYMHNLLLVLKQLDAYNYFQSSIHCGSIYLYKWLLYAITLGWSPVVLLVANTYHFRHSGLQ